MSFDQLFDGSDAHLLPSNAADCAAKLRQYNRWRRGEDDWSPDEKGPNPKELGLLIDYAADALQNHATQLDELLHFAEMYICQYCGYQITNTSDAKHDATGWLRDMAQAAIKNANNGELKFSSKRSNQ